MVEINDEIDVYRDKEYLGNSSFTAVTTDGHLYSLKEYVIHPVIKFLWKCKTPVCSSFFETITEFDKSIVTKASKTDHNHFFNRQALKNLKKTSIKHLRLKKEKEEIKEESDKREDDIKPQHFLASSFIKIDNNMLLEYMLPTQTATKSTRKRDLPDPNPISKRPRRKAAINNTAIRNQFEAEDHALSIDADENLSPPLLIPYYADDDDKLKNTKPKKAPKSRQAKVPTNPPVSDDASGTHPSSTTEAALSVAVPASNGILSTSEVDKVKNTKAKKAPKARQPKIPTNPPISDDASGTHPSSTSEAALAVAIPALSNNEIPSTNDDDKLKDTKPKKAPKTRQAKVPTNPPISDDASGTHSSSTSEAALSVAVPPSNGNPSTNDVDKLNNTKSKKAPKTRQPKVPTNPPISDDASGTHSSSTSEAALTVAVPALSSNGIPSTSDVDKFRLYKFDQSELFGDLENEEEREEEYSAGQHYAVDIGEVIENSKIKYQITRKMGFGNFSLAWLAYEKDKKSKKFVALKIYKSNNLSTKDEIKNLKLVKNNEHIVRYFRSFQIDRNGRRHDCAVFEPLGSTLLTLLKRANTGFRNGNVGLRIDAIKKIARHAFLGLQHLHEDLHFVHTDIKPENILTTVTERSLFLAVKEVQDSDCRKTGMRAVCFKDKPLKIGLTTVKKDLGKILDDTPLPLSVDAAEMIQNRANVSDEVCWDVIKFKLIDLGNAVKPASNLSTAGTFEYRAPENSFGAPLTYTFDVWSVGCVIVELATGKQLFTSVDRQHDSRDLMKSITRHLGKVPHGVYKEFKDRDKLLNEFSTTSNVCFSRRFNLKNLFSTFYYTETEIQEMVDFLNFLFNFDPKERPSVARCLEHKWLQ